MKILIREIDETLRGAQRKQAQALAVDSMLRSSLLQAGLLTDADGNRIGGDDMASRESTEAAEAAAAAPLPERATSEHGKPYLPALPQFHYNVSHSGRFVVLAASYPDDNKITVQAPGEIGIDIQQMVPVRGGITATAQRFYTPAEAVMLEGLSGEETADMQRELFYQLWSIKEAYLKCIGTGLTGGMNTFTIEPAGAHRDAGLIRDNESGKVTARYLLISSPDPEYVMAVCVAITE